MVGCDVIQLGDEGSTGRILGAVEDALEDGLVLSIDVVVLQDAEDGGNMVCTSAEERVKRYAGHI